MGPLRPAVDARRLSVRWLGTVPYPEAFDLQRVLAGGDRDMVLLLEHPHVYTRGRSATEGNLRVPPEALRAPVLDVDRGGDITYHGPGQLVGYPILSIPAGPQFGPPHVRRIEAWLIAALVRLGMAPGRVGRLEGYPGIWVDPRGPDPRKIAAIGVRAARGRTTHGFALNVTTDLSMFDDIVPCGIPDHGVTSLAAEGIEVGMADVVDAIVATVPALVDGEPRDVDVAGVTPAVPAAEWEDGDRAGLSHTERRIAAAGVALGEAVAFGGRKPGWMRVTARTDGRYLPLRRDLGERGLVTVCAEAGCPNIFECWSEGTATFMINGERCTRACTFCLVDTSKPLPIDPGEARRVAEAVEAMGLRWAVVTCVARDDLEDGGASGFVATIRAIRERTPGVGIEVLVSDFEGRAASLDLVLAERPDVLNHNVETVVRLQRAVRPKAGYARSLTVLARSKAAGLVTKSGIIVGMGETPEEVLATMEDLRAVGVDILTVGQYLRPTERHTPVARWWAPEEFDELRRRGLEMGFAAVEASPLTRSSHHAHQAARAAGVDVPGPGVAPVPVPVAIEARA